MTISYTLKFGTTEQNLADSPIVPNSVTIGFSDVDYEAGRTADGTMHRNKVDTKRKLELSFPPCADGVAMKTLLEYFQNEYFYCQYTDPLLNNATTKLFYAGDRAVPVYSYALGMYDSMTVNIVEV